MKYPNILWVWESLTTPVRPLIFIDCMLTTVTVSRIPCPDVEDAPAALTDAVPRKYADCSTLPLRQHWRGADALPREGGVARIGASASGLAVHIRFEDSDIFSTATADQQRLWLLGDVVEVFVKPGRARDDYWEVHMSPNGFLMDLLIPDRPGYQRGDYDWETVNAADSGTSHQVRVEEGSWAAEAIVPWSAFGVAESPAPGATWQVGVCRFNFTGGLHDPELSSTASLTQPGFHRYEEFTDLLF